MFPRHHTCLWLCFPWLYKGSSDPSLNPTGFALWLLPCCVLPDIWVCRWWNHLLYKVPQVYHFWEVLQSQFPQHKVEEAPSNKWHSHVGNGHCFHCFVAASKIGFPTPQTFWGPRANHCTIVLWSLKLGHTTHCNPLTLLYSRQCVPLHIWNLGNFINCSLVPW